MISSDAVSIRILFGNVGAEPGHIVRSAVFIDEQGVPASMEWDGLDHLCVHAIALDASNQPIGTGRLMPDGRVGRMAVLAPWRGQGVGSRLLQALLAEHRARRWPPAYVHAQLSAADFYARRGFRSVGAPFEEAGIAHVLMRFRGGAQDRD